MKTKELSQILEKLLDELTEAMGCNTHQHYGLVQIRRKAIKIQKILAEKKTHEKKKK